VVCAVRRRRRAHPAHSLALRPAHSRGHLFVARYTEGFSHFVASMTVPGASTGGPFPHWTNAAFSRRTPQADIRDRSNPGSLLPELVDDSWPHAPEFRAIVECCLNQNNADALAVRSKKAELALSPRQQPSQVSVPKSGIRHAQSKVRVGAANRRRVTFSRPQTHAVLLVDTIESVISRFCHVSCRFAVERTVRITRVVRPV
jgi:hypothetical protein